MDAASGSTGAGPDANAAHSQPNALLVLKARVDQQTQIMLDAVAPFIMWRWIATAILFASYCVRVYLLQGFFIVTYALGIFLLNLLIGFLSPAIDPESEESILPTKSTDEFRPFERRLPEFKFWISTSKAITIAIFVTFFKSFDVPVFWPILLIYFIALFFATMRRQIQHMIRYRYIPFDFGKRRYRSVPNAGADTAAATKDKE